MVLDIVHLDFEQTVFVRVFGLSAERKEVILEDCVIDTKKKMKLGLLVDRLAKLS